MALQGKADFYNITWGLFVELFLLYLCLAIFNGYVGRNRLIGFWGFFFASLLLTPILTLLVLLFSSPRNREKAA